MTEEINKSKVMLKTMESKTSSKNVNNENDYKNLKSELEKIKKEKEELTTELENANKLLETKEKEFKSNFNVMESLLFRNNEVIAQKDES